MIYDHIKSYKKPEIHPLSRKYILEKDTGGGSNWHLPSLLRVQVYFAYYSVSHKLLEISSPYIFMLVEAPKHALTCDS